MRHHLRRIVLAALLALAIPAARAQAPESEPLTEVRLESGLVLRGRLLSQTADQLVLEGQNGQPVTVARALVREVRVAPDAPAQAAVAAAPVPAAPAEPTARSARLLLSPTARMPREGEMSVAQTELLLTQFEVGLSDHVAFTARGALPLALFGSLYGSVGLRVGGTFGEDLHLAAGAEAVGALGVMLAGGGATYGSGGVGLYGVATLGAERNHLTVLAGATLPGLLGSGAGLAPHLMVGGQVSLSDALSLVSENWVLSGPWSNGFGAPLLLGSAVLRGEWGRWSLDAGAVVAPQLPGALPWLSVGYTWR